VTLHAQQPSANYGTRTGRARRGCECLCHVQITIRFRIPVEASTLSARITLLESTKSERRASKTRSPWFIAATREVGACIPMFSSATPG
jgi:hypothetical protein